MKRLRADARISQHELAVAVGVTAGAISQIETEKISPRRDTARRIDDALGAEGAVVSAFGFGGAITQPDVRRDVAELRERFGELADQVEALSRSVLEMGAELEQLRRGSGRGET